MKHRLLVASTNATIGSVVFLVLGAISRGLFGSLVEAAGCFVGAFISTALVAREANRTAQSNAGAAVLVVLVTLSSIALAHAIEQPLVRGVPIDQEWRSLLFWSVITTSWWLVPAAAWVLAQCNRRLPTVNSITPTRAG